MTFEVQLIVVAVLVALSAAYVVRSAWRTFFGKKAGCGSGCGKCAAPPATPQPEGRISLPQV
ncbi:MAG TPA: FeoB-associated Cys-rich membrane protein [Gemmataceae bacterium]|nr:FeoB-associated Cys-rich membrane protein [Gemmataceae bacterium]